MRANGTSGTGKNGSASPDSIPLLIGYRRASSRMLFFCSGKTSISFLKIKKKEDLAMKERYEGISLIPVMEKILDRNTKCYKSDFRYDREDLIRASEKSRAEDMTFIWLCRPYGTWLWREKDVFIRDTSQHNALCFYAEQAPEGILAYAVEVTGMEGRGVIGNLRLLDFNALYERIKKLSLEPGRTILRYENGETEQPAEERISVQPDSRYGKFLSFDIRPKDEERLAEILRNERNLIAG